MNKPVEEGVIVDAKKRYSAGVLKYKQMGYWQPDYQPKDTDVIAMFRVTPQEGVDAEECAALRRPASTRAGRTCGTWCPRRWKPTPTFPLSSTRITVRRPAVCQQSIRSGFTSVMMHGSLMEDSKTPASYDYNVEVTRKVCEFSHAIGVSVEGELACLGSLETGEAGEEDGVGAGGKLSHDMLLTDPDQAKGFVAKTGVDALAIAIGTSHGAYKFTRKPTGDILAIERIANIHAAVPGTHLVMHGSSSVPPPEWLEIIRKYGGDIKETYGVPVEEIQRGIRSGVRKINIDTDIRLAMTGAMHKALAEQRSEFDPRKAMLEAKKAARGIVQARFDAFGCVGHATRIKPVALEAMTKRYH